MFVPYPDLDDDNFYKKIYQKKEFYQTKPPPLPDPDNQSEETLSSLFPKRGEFKLLPQQIFLKNFISEATPYNGILVVHGTGVGKTCASISIAEGFYERVQETGKKVLMIVSPNIENEFYKTIFNFEKDAAKKSKRQIVQCTGKRYELGEDFRYVSSKKKEATITKMIKDVYEIIGRDKLKNRTLREIGWDGKTINDSIKEKISEMFSDRVIIVDEVHTRTGTIGKPDNFPDFLEDIIRYSDNVKLILMSATPMFNDPEDIIYPINLLRINDDREEIKKTDVFKADGTFTKDGVEIFKKAARGYVSYVRGGDPPRFPYKIIPPEAKVPKAKFDFHGEKIKDKIEHTRIIECYSQPFQFNNYRELLKSEIGSAAGGLLSGTLQAGNIICPSTSKDVGLYGSDMIGGERSDSHPIIKYKNKKGREVYKYGKYSNGFLLRKNIEKYSAKFATIFDNIVESRGISFVYSKWFKSGVLPLALMLEENGFEPAIITGNETFLFSSNTNTICYYCGKTRHPVTDHEWGPARYVILTSSLDTVTLTEKKICMENL
jgi:hypothetical protein